MRLRLFLAALAIMMTATLVNAEDPDYLSLLAAESEIQAIAVVSSVQRMSGNADGTFTRVTFKRIYALTPFTPTSFVGACKVMDNSWQKRAPGTVYFKPRQGQKVYVTITTNGGAITSYTLMTPQLDSVIRKAPHRLAYQKGRARVLPLQE